MEDEKADDYIDFGQFIDVNKNFDFIQRLLIKKVDIIDSVDDYAIYFEDPVTGQLYFAYDVISGWAKPEYAFEELTGIKNATFAQIAPKEYISYPKAYLFQVALNR